MAVLGRSLGQFSSAHMPCLTSKEANVRAVCNTTLGVCH